MLIAKILVASAELQQNLVTMLRVSVAASACALIQVLLQRAGTQRLQNKRADLRPRGWLFDNCVIETEMKGLLT